MEVTALCRTLSVKVFVLLLAQLHHHSAQERVALIVPTKLQLFEYSSVSINCEGFNSTSAGTVVRRVNGKVGECVSTWETTPASVCAIKPVYSRDSGEYWCESGQQRSNVVNITITGGAVLLESPALPVMEGDAVTLCCRSKMTSSAVIADFYKDDVPIGIRSTGEMTIRGVSKSNEGLYKCSIPEFGESPQSWLAVTGVGRETRPSSDPSCHIYLVLRTLFTVVMVALLLLLLGLLHCGKLRVTHKYP